MKKNLTFLILMTLALIAFSISAFATDGESVAAIGEKEFSSLQEAIDASSKGDTIKLLTDINIETDVSTSEASGLFVISSNDDITIDLNEKSINVIESCSSHFLLFYNRGTLTLKNGSISLTSTIDRSWNAESAIIMNRGANLTIESGEYIHNGGTSMAFVVDNSGNSFGDAYATINGGVLRSTYNAIRMRMADTTLNGEPGNGEVFLNVNGGTIHGNSSGVWGQITNAYSGQLGNLEVSGGIVSGGKNAINMTTDGYDNIDVSISGDAQIIGNIKGEGSDFAISGGSFTVAVAPELFADGFAIVDNGDGTYGVGVSLASAFAFLGYSVPEVNPTSITAGFTIDHSIITLYCEQNKIESFDFGCAFGIDAINTSTAKSFASYTHVQNLNVKICGFEPSKQNYNAFINANLALALYVDCGNGQQYVTEINGVIAIVSANEVPTVTFASFFNSEN